MNIWEELAGLECRITDKALRAAWALMVQTRSPKDCALVQKIAEDVPDAFLFWKLAYRAEELADIEQSFRHLLVKVTE